MSAVNENAPRCQPGARGADYETYPLKRITSERWQRVTPRHPCPVCGHPDWCCVTPDAAIAGCMRIEHGAFKTVSTGAGPMHLHRVRDDSPTSLRLASHTHPGARKKTIAAAPIEHRQRVYSEFLRGLTLSLTHAAYLRDLKGLSEETMTRNLYATMPAPQSLASIAASLAHDFDLSAVPGFYRSSNGWNFSAKDGELLIPCRDHAERISAILMRTGGTPKYRYASSAHLGGASSGAPIHYALPYLIDLQGLAIITEGVLKADTVAEKLHVATVGIPGVGSFSAELGHDLRNQLPALCKVSIAFDADEQRNSHVRAALIRLIRSLKAAGFSPDVLRWSEEDGKGLDDVLMRSTAKEAV